MDFKIFQILSQNPNLLAFSFIVKYRFVAKTDRNSVFLDREAHIPDQLYIIVMYISFKGFKKIRFCFKIQRCWPSIIQKNASYQSGFTTLPPAPLLEQPAVVRCLRGLGLSSFSYGGSMVDTRIYMVQAAGV
jgi:hypothetical protein